MKVKNVEIFAIQDDIFAFSQENAECMILWIRHGFNGMNSKWMFEFVPKIKNMQLQEYSIAANTWLLLPSENYLFAKSPWRRNGGRLIRLGEPLGKLVYFLLLSNTADAKENDVDRIRESLNQTLEQLNHANVTSFCLNGIQGDGKRQDKMNAETMLGTVLEWVRVNDSGFRQIFFVDEGGYFQLPEER
jgi:hypothetical protein